MLSDEDMSEWKDAIHTEDTLSEGDMKDTDICSSKKDWDGLCANLLDPPAGCVTCHLSTGSLQC